MLSGSGWAALYTSGLIGVFVESQTLTEVIRMSLIVLAATIVWRQVFLYRKIKRKGDQSG